jgi:parvulin-like peptidyl-prolyl isomerase
MLLVFGTGCGSDRKSALTEEEIREKTYAPLPTRPDEIIISSETITCEDVMISPPEEEITGPSLKERLQARAREVPLEQFLAETRPLIQQRLNRNIITRIVLSKRARRELGENADDTLDKMVEKELRRFILEEHGGNGAEADAALQRRGMNRATFMERRKRDLLAQYVIDSKFRRNRPVTHGEILAQYEKVKDQEFLRQGVLQLRLIAIEVAKVKLEGPDEDPVQKARQLAEDLRKRIDAGADFAELAKQYSHDPLGSQGGLLRPRNPEAFAAPYDVLAAQAKEMKAGQVAGPIETPGRFFIMKVEDKQEQGYQPLAEVQDQMREEILRARRRAALEELEAEIAREATMADTTQFVDYCLERLYRLARSSPGSQPAGQ